MAGGKVIDGFNIGIGLDDSDLSKGIAKAQSTFGNFITNLTKQVSGPLTAAFGALASGAAIQNYLNKADAIGKMADSIDADIEELQAWGIAVEHAGGSASGLQGTVQGLTQRLQEVSQNAGGEMAQALSSLGVSATDASGKTKDVFQVLSDLSEKAEGMDKQKFVGIARKLGIDQGTIMLLQSGKQATEEAIKRAKELGLYTKEDADIAAAANDSFTDLKQVLDSFVAMILRFIVPVIQKMTSTLTDVIVGIRKHQPFVIAALAGIATVITASMLPALYKMATAAWAAVAPFLPFIALVIGLALVFDDFWGYCHGAESELEEFWKQFGEGPELLKKFETFWNDVKSAAKAFFDALKPEIPAMIKNVSAVVAAWAGINAWKKAIKIFNGVKKAITGVGGALKLLSANPLGAFLTACMLIWMYSDEISQSFMSIYNWICKIIDKLPSWENMKKSMSEVKQFYDNSDMPDPENVETIDLNSLPSNTINAGRTQKNTKVESTTTVGQVVINTSSSTMEGAGKDMEKGINDQNHKTFASANGTN